MNIDGTVKEAVEVGSELINNTKRQMQLIANALPAEKQREMKLVFLKLDEARLWLREIGND